MNFSQLGFQARSFIRNELSRLSELIRGQILKTVVDVGGVVRLENDFIGSRMAGGLGVGIPAVSLSSGWALALSWLCLRFLDCLWVE